MIYHVLQSKNFLESKSSFNAQIFFILARWQMFLMCAWNIWDITKTINNKLATHIFDKYFPFQQCYLDLIEHVVAS